MMAIGAALALGTMALAGCSSAKSPHVSAPTTSTTSSAPTVTATSGVPTVVTTTLPPITTPQIPSGFALAKSQWEQGAMAASADQVGFWNQAVTDLTGAESSAGSNEASYATAVQELQQLISIPETGDTPTQIAEAQTDVPALDSFFSTPGLYS
jgi:hypothetical protein